MNNLTSKLESIFSKVKLKQYKNDEVNKELNGNEIEKINDYLITLEEIRSELKNTHFKYSQYLEWIFLLKHILIDLENNLSYYKFLNEDYYKILNLIINFSNLALQAPSNSIIHEDIQDFIPLKKEDIKVEIDLFIVNAAFVDYFIVESFQLFYKILIKDMNLDLNKITNSLEVILSNSASFWDENDLTKFTYNSTTLNNGHKDSKKLVLSESMINDVTKSVKNVKDFNSQLLENSLTPNLILEILELLNLWKSFDFKNESLKRLKNIFPANSRISERKKKLIIHQILLYYKHPQAMTPVDDENFLSNENSTIITLEQTKVRLVERILGI